MPVISKFTVGGHEVTKYNYQRLRQFEINGEVCPFAKVAQSLNGILSDPISYRIHRLQAAGNSSQATGSVPKYNCQGHSSVLKIGSFIKGDIYAVPITSDGITATFSQSDGTYAITGTSSAQGNVLLHNQITLVSGHKYMVPTFRDATAAGVPNYFQWGNVYARGIPAANFYWPDQTKAQSWAIVTGNGTAGYCTFNFMNNLDTSVTGFDPSGCFNLIDLTELYGAGNEPANPETVFQDYPEIPAGNDSWVKNDAIRSISSITLGGQTVSVDLRSAGTVYDEWSTNSRGTRKTGLTVYAAANVSATSAYTNVAYFMVYKPSYSRGYNNPEAYGFLNNYATVYPYYYNAGMSSWDDAGGIGKAFSGFYFGNLVFGFAPGTTLAEAQAALDGMQFCYELASANYSAFTAGSPLTLASGLSPVDQNGNAVTYTETTEDTPSPNYPEPIVNSTLISITDGQDTNSAAVDLAGLTDRDEVYVNVRSTNIWDEEWEVGDYSAVNGSTVTSNRIRNKNPIPISDENRYYFASPKNAYLFYYDEDMNFIRYVDFAVNNSFQPAAGAKYVNFSINASYGTTYNHDISISIGSSAVPYMPHDTIGKAWIKQELKLIDLGDLTYQKSSTSQNTYYFKATLSDKPKRPSAATNLGQLLCTAYKNTAGLYVYQAVSNYTIAIPHDNDIVMLYDLDTQAMTEAQYRTYAAGIKLLYALANPIWSDITSTATGAALLALETTEETSNTITINNSGLIDMVQYFTPI